MSCVNKWFDLQEVLLTYHCSNERVYGVRMLGGWAVPSRDENIRYIHRYIFDISDISDVRHDIDDD